MPPEQPKQEQSREVIEQKIGEVIRHNQDVLKAVSEEASDAQVWQALREQG